ncbi:MAG: Dihydrofolate reductase [Mucilaginibacter sp.]|nr:Dihydrofolate reductase [Mucilaginibacter sp.]
MRKLKLQVQMSVDGFIADKDGKTSWMIWNWDEDWNWDKELKKYFNDLTANVDCVLLSRKMAAEGFINHWKNVAQNPDPNYNFARKITAAKKVVFTKTLETAEWDNTVLAKGALAEEIDRLKKTEGKDLIAYGGATFVSGLIQNELIDEYYLFINPVIIGNGLSIFNSIDQNLNLKLVEAINFECGVTVLYYRI